MFSPLPSPTGNPASNTWLQRPIRPEAGARGGVTLSFVIWAASGDPSHKKTSLGPMDPGTPCSALAIDIRPQFPRAQSVFSARVGLLASGSAYSPRLPILTDSGTSGFRPRSQRRHRDGLAPSSLVALLEPPVHSPVVYHGTRARVNSTYPQALRRDDLSTDV